MTKVVPFPKRPARVGRHVPKDEAARAFLQDEVDAYGLCECGHTIPAHAFYRNACHEPGCPCKKAKRVEDKQCSK